MNLLKYIAHQFGKPTGIGGKIATLIMNVINKKQYSATIENLNIQNGDTLLDIGFGNGFWLKKIVAKQPKMLYGNDISEDMLKLAVEKNKTLAELGKIKLFQADIQKMPFEDNTFDKIYTVNTVYFWQNMNEAFAEIRRVLKPNGLFINTIHSKNKLDKIIITKYDFVKYDVDELEKLTVENGFKSVKTVEIEKNKTYCICVKKS